MEKVPGRLEPAEALHEHDRMGVRGHILRTLVAAAYLVCSLRAVAQSVIWTGGGDGTSWGQAANWSSNPALPGPMNDVVILSGSQAVSVTTPVSIRSLSLNRAMNISGGWLRITNGVDLTSGAAIITNASADGDGLSFAGTQSISGSGQIALGNSSLRVVGAGTVLTIDPGIVVRNRGGVIGAGRIFIEGNATLINQGAIRATRYDELGNTLTVSGSTTSRLINTGTLEVVGAVLSIGSIGTVNEGRLVIRGGLFELGGRIDSFGTIDRIGGRLGFFGEYTGQTLTVSSATGPIALFGNASINGTTVTATDGQALSITGNALFSNVTLGANISIGGNTGCSTLTVANGLTMVNDAVISVVGGGGGGCDGLRFSGTQSITGTGQIAMGSSPFHVVDAGTLLSVGPGIVLRNSAGADAAIIIDSGARLENQGLLQVSGTSRTLSVSGTGGTLVNQGAILLDPGSIMLVGGAATLDLEPAGSIRFGVSGPSSVISDSVARMVVNAGASLFVGGTIIVAHMYGFAPTACQPLLTLISGAGTIVGNFTSAIVPERGTLRSAVSYPGNTVSFAFPSRADVAALGGALTPDGQLTADDIIAFLNAFFSGNLAVADVAGLGGTPGPDGQLTPDDLIVFLDSFFAGCQ